MGVTRVCVLHDASERVHHLVDDSQYHDLLPAVCALIEIVGVQWMESATCERGISIRTLTKIGQQYSLGDSLLAALVMIDLNGPDIEAVDEVKALILPNSGICQCVEELQQEDAVKEQCRCTPTE